MHIGKSVQAKIVQNHWGWGLRGIANWVRYGWGWFATWGVEGANGERDSDCLKVGPVALSWPCPNGVARGAAATGE